MADFFIRGRFHVGKDVIPCPFPKMAHCDRNSEAQKRFCSLAGHTCKWTVRDGMAATSLIFCHTDMRGKNGDWHLFAVTYSPITQKGEGGASPTLHKTQDSG